MNKTIAIIGLGLIGGSLAKAIKENTPHTVLGMDQNSKVADFALSCGAIHAIASDADLQQADLVFLGLYPAAAVAFAEEKGNLLRKDAIICDVSGIKTWLCKKMPLLAERDVNKRQIRGLESRGPKSIIAPIPTKSKSGNASDALIPTLNSHSMMPWVVSSPTTLFSTPVNGMFTKMAPNPIGSSKAGSKSFLIASQTVSYTHLDVYKRQASIMVLVTGIIGYCFADPTVGQICRTISIGALSATLLILFVLPGLLVTFDRLIVKKARRSTLPQKKK